VADDSYTNTFDGRNDRPRIFGHMFRKVAEQDTHVEADVDSGAVELFCELAVVQVISFECCAAEQEIYFLAGRSSKKKDKKTEMFRRIDKHNNWQS